MAAMASRIPERQEEPLAAVAVEEAAVYPLALPHREGLAAQVLSL